MPKDKVWNGAMPHDATVQTDMIPHSEMQSNIMRIHDTKIRCKTHLAPHSSFAWFDAMQYHLIHNINNVFCTSWFSVHVL